MTAPAPCLLQFHCPPAPTHLRKMAESDRLADPSCPPIVQRTAVARQRIGQPMATTVPPSAEELAVRTQWWDWNNLSKSGGFSWLVASDGDPKTLMDRLVPAVRAALPEGLLWQPHLKDGRKVPGGMSVLRGVLEHTTVRVRDGNPFIHPAHMAAFVEAVHRTLMGTAWAGASLSMQPEHYAFNPEDLDYFLEHTVEGIAAWDLVQRRYQALMLHQAMPEAATATRTRL